MIGKVVKWAVALVLSATVVGCQSFASPRAAETTLIAGLVSNECYTRTPNGELLPNYNLSQNQITLCVALYEAYRRVACLDGSASAGSSGYCGN